MPPVEGEIWEAKQCFTFCASSQAQTDLQAKQRSGPGDIFREPSEKALSLPQCTPHPQKSYSEEFPITKFL